MIKLGVQNENQVKVDTLANTINNSKLELESINTEKVEKQKELNDVLTQLDFAVEDLNSKQEVTNSAIKKNTAKIDKLNTEIAELETVKSDLEVKVKEITDSLEVEKSKMLADIKDFEKIESKKLNTLNVEVAALEAQKAELEDFIQVLSVDSLANSVTVDNLKEEIAKLETELVTKREEDIALDSKFVGVTNMHGELSSEINSLNADIDNLNEIINSLTAEITKIQEIKNTLTSEVEALNVSKEEFNREKLAFQSNKELILLREQYIREKYNLAGVPYK